MITSLTVDDLAVVIHQTARDHGFWDKERNLGEMLMLATSELAEALEEDRDGRPNIWFRHSETCSLQSLSSPVQVMLAPPTAVMCSCNPKPEGALVEIIDCIIRCLDTAQHLASRTPYEVGEVMDLKMTYNAQREHMHGKGY